MATVGINLSFLNNPKQFTRSPYEDDETADLREECLGSFDPMNIISAPVAQPSSFCEDIKLSGAAPGLMDFKHGTTTMAFKFNGGIIVAVDSRASMGSYIGSQTVRKVIEINEQLLGTMAGGAADCYYWEHYLAMQCRLHNLRHKEEPISVAAASKILSNIFYEYKGRGLSCGTMIAGCDHHTEVDKDGTHLYFIDDEGTRYKNDFFSCGSGSIYATGVFHQYFRPDITFEEAVDLGKRAIIGATHRDAASGGLVRVYHVHSKGWTKIEDGLDVDPLIHEKILKGK